MGMANIWPKFAENCRYLFLKALISCIFPKNITDFCDFLENIYMYHVFNQNILLRNLKKFLKCSLFARKMVYFMSPSDCSSFLQWKRLLKGCSELIFLFSLQNLYLYNNFNQKIVHKIFHLTTKLKFVYD